MGLSFEFETHKIKIPSNIKPPGFIFGRQTKTPHGGGFIFEHQTKGPRVGFIFGGVIVWKVFILV
jgi:hypothetical protein